MGGYNMFIPMDKKRTFRLLPYTNERMFVARLKKVEMIDQNDCRVLFTSDSLANMAGMACDRKGQYLFVFNVTGDAYLYDLPSQKRLFSKLKLRKLEGSGETTVAFFEHDCFYIDKEYRLCRLDLETGVAECISGIEQRITKLLQIQDKLYIFHSDAEEHNISVCEYVISNRQLALQRSAQIEGYHYIKDIKYDYDGKSVVIYVEPAESRMPILVVFDPAALAFLPIQYTHPRELPALGFHTHLKKNLIAFAFIDGVDILNINSGKLEARYSKKDGMEYCCDAQFLEDTAIMFASWKGIYIVEPDELLFKAAEDSLDLESEEGRAYLKAMEMLTADADS
jgi:hypothetical protein